MNRWLLTFNAGSSTIKLGVFRLDGPRAGKIGHGQLDLHLSPLRLRLEIEGATSTVAIDADPVASMDKVLEQVLHQLEVGHDQGALCAVGHRVVHGGLHLAQSVLLDERIEAELQALAPLAPLHQPQNLRLIRAVARLRPGLPQSASFDTAFHADQDALARRFALPRELHEQGVLRYGFHGLSYSYIAAELRRRQLPEAHGNVVVAHLGNGASLCGIQNGRSVDASTGFSTLDGVPMGTRCGALDAGVLLYLLQQGMTPAALEDLLYHRSGLLGVSGVSADVRTLQQSQAAPAREALELFALRCAGEAARLAATLRGMDALVFTAGIGEHDARMRAAICARLDWLGVQLDESANEKHQECISHPASRVRVLVIPTDEEQVIADDAARLIHGSTS
ncbi:acetate kinase [Herbaspirillum sp. GW103]|jgi:acetate kinase|uniref:acetate/propionate family kinase n=1 Tax=unclassified Herbaspirillum TaxID=2624150 RepID=UPI00025E43EE|nr:MULTISPECIES: acetate/propionate family kinase [unclassified Herbaspirillum]EIJ44971.1 acetate kinase [Herbaspirillum sp. GW103]MCI1004683.1 acetate/propionate family kinase [Herbaspirillum sp. C7C8]NUT60502.1 acetate/propionate family kinase [Herbaspirillum sp. C9C3]